MISMNEVANKAGVSRATVSYVLNGRAEELRIPLATRERVLEVANTHGYKRNELVRAAMSSQSKVLGFVLLYSDGESAARILRGTIEEAQSRGYSVKVIQLQEENGLDREAVEKCLELRLAGLMVLYLSDEMLEYLHTEMTRFQIPVAIVDSSQPKNWGLRVDTDDNQGMRLAVEHLFELGHRKIALISSRLPVRGGTIGFGAAREAAFRAAMKEFGLRVPKDFVPDAHSNRAKMGEAARALLSRPNRPTAIIGVTDAEAVVGMGEALRLGLETPRDVSFVGYGGLPFCLFAPTPLTAIEQPFVQIGRIGAHHLLNRIEGKQGGRFDDSPRQELLASRLVKFQSTGPAPKI